MESLHNLKKPFGKMDYTVSPLGLGTVKFGRNIRINNAGGDGKPLPSLQKCSALIDQAIELGVNMIDTAPAYGSSESVLGKVISPEIRKKIILTTKIGETFDSTTGHSKHAFDKSSVTSSIQKSLQSLNTDYLDFVFVHCSRNDLDNLKSSDAFEILETLKKQGVIRGFGASIYTKEAANYALEHSDGIMVTYNLSDSSMQSVIENAHYLGKAIAIKKGFLQGHLEKHNLNDVLQHVLQQPAQTLICGTLNPQHLAENIKLTAQILKGSS